jgi:hypothetical protein
MQERIRGCRTEMQVRFPNAIQLVYDNYNFLVIGFGPTARASDAPFSLAAYARGVNLCFLHHGAELPDPGSLLRGSGKVVRNVPLNSPRDLARPDVDALIGAELQRSGSSMTAANGREVVIKSVSPKQRPRR